MLISRRIVPFVLLLSCANSVSVRGGAGDAAFDGPPFTSDASADAGVPRDASAEETGDAPSIDPRCPQRPCLSAPLIRATSLATWLLYPDGRTLVWGVWGPEIGGIEPRGVRYTTPSAGPRLSDDVLDFSVANFDGCALLANPRRVSCWGGNEVGELGRGVRSAVGANEALAGVPGVTDVEAIAALDYSSWALTPSGSIVWGSSQILGEHGRDRLNPFPAPPNAVRYATGKAGRGWGYLTSDGQIFAFGTNEEGAAGSDQDAAVLQPTRVSGLSNVVDYSAGPWTSCAVVGSGDVYCWGRRAGVLNHDGSPPTSTSIPERVDGLDDAARVHVGSELACVLTRTRRVRCWGRVNWDRQDAGLNAVVVTSPPGAALVLPPVREVAVGDQHACALTMDGDVYCWGNNHFGQLGIARFGSDSTNPLHVVLPP